jgi:hypothetical protein
MYPGDTVRAGAPASPRPERLWIRSDSQEDADTVAIHELTHWLQFHNGFHPMKCPQSFLIEYQAYTVTWIYKVKYKHVAIPDDYDVPGVNCSTQPPQVVK